MNMIKCLATFSEYFCVIVSMCEAVWWWMSESTRVTLVLV
jgi:hypothetical protein